MDITADSVVTGGTGFIGRWLVAELTRRGRQVVVLARGGARRADELAAFVDSHHGDSRNLTVIHGDLQAEVLGINETLRGVRDVYHLAAAFSFGMSAHRAREINVGGTVRVAQWAADQPDLRRVVHLAGYRATVMPPWLSSAPYPLPARVQKRLYRSRGAYEASKLESHLAMQAYAATHDLPITAVHPSSVIGDSVTGETSQVTGIGDTVEQLWRGTLPALAGSAATFVPLISVDYVAAFMASIPPRDETLGQQLCVLDNDTPRLPELVSDIAAHLGVTAPRHIVPTAVVARLPTFVTGIEPEALEFLTDDEYDTASADTHSLTAGLSKPDIHETTRRWATHLVSTNFGNAPTAETGQFVSAAGSRTFVVGDVRNDDSLFLHGLPWDGDSGRALGLALQGTMARADLPGMGRSSLAETTNAAWLADLLDERSEPVTLVSHSLSTGIAIRYALQHPGKVRSLVLISPFFLQTRAPWHLRWSPLAARLLRLGNAAALQTRLIGVHERLDPAVASAHNNLSRRGVATHIGHSLSRASRRSERAALRKGFEQLTVPVLVIHGASDRLTDSPPRAEVEEISHAGHSPHVEQPERVARVIHSFHECEAERAACSA